MCIRAGVNARAAEAFRGTYIVSRSQIELQYPCGGEFMGRDDVLQLLAAHRNEIERFGVESLRLFGSVARGEAAAGSDVDLLVSFRETPTFSGYMKLRIFLEDLLGAQVDLITESGSRKGVRPFVENDAIR